MEPRTPKESRKERKKNLRSRGRERSERTKKGEEGEGAPGEQTDITRYALKCGDISVLPFFLLKLLSCLEIGTVQQFLLPTFSVPKPPSSSISLEMMTQLPSMISGAVRERLAWMSHGGDDGVQLKRASTRS